MNPQSLWDIRQFHYTRMRREVRALTTGILASSATRFKMTLRVTEALRARMVSLVVRARARPTRLRFPFTRNGDGRRLLRLQEGYVWRRFVRKSLERVRKDPGGGYFENFWVGMCNWEPGTLGLYQS